MNASRRTLLMILVGVLLAGGIIAGVTAAVSGGVIPSPSSGGSTTTKFTVTTVYSNATAVTTITSGSVTPTGTLAAQMTDPPVIFSGVSNIYINYTDIEAHSERPGNVSVWYSIASTGTIDLLSIVNESSTIGSLRVPTGTFDQLRFGVNSGIVTYDEKNYSASIPPGELVLPIPSGGAAVNTNQSTGMLIQVSPTVLPQRFGTSVRFALIISARVFVIPSQDWHSSLDAKGSRLSLSNKPWFSQTRVDLNQYLKVTSAFVSSNSLLLVLNNTGVPVALSSISIIVPDNNSDPVATFAILSNASVVQPSTQISGTISDYQGITSRPNKTTVLLFIGQISTLNNPSQPLTQFSITGGSHYIIQVADQYGDIFQISVIASYPATS